MRIEITTLVELDLLAERKRIEEAFRKDPEVQAKLLSLVERFEQGQFEALADELATWPREELEYVHSDIFDVLKATRSRMLSARKLEDFKAKCSDVPGLEHVHDSLVRHSTYPRHVVLN